jgi:hypothetical protein
MNFSVVIPTRGDQDLTPILESYDGIADEVLIWDNSKRQDLSVYGRYAMIEEARNELILTQDDDCVVSDPRVIVDEWKRVEHFNLERHPGMPYDHHVVCNMPSRFRHGFYDEHALVGFGACFHRDLPEMAFRQWDFLSIGTEGLGSDTDFFHRTCDVFFTALTPYTLVDVPYENLPWAEGDDRMYRQPGHQAERSKMLELAFRVKDVADD